METRDGMAARPLSAAGRIGRREKIRAPFRAEEVLGGKEPVSREHQVVNDALAKAELRGKRAAHHDTG